MYLIDSNIIMYSYVPKYEYLKAFILREHTFISEISRLEVLGYHKLSNNEEKYFVELFDITALIVPSQKVYDTSIKLRRQYNLKLGDSLIAATAQVYDLEIYTRNLKDFEKIRSIRTFNPII